MKNTQKGSVALWVIILILVIVIGGIYWYSTENSSQPAVSSGTETQQTVTNTNQTRPTQNSSISATIDKASLTSKAKFPTITGTATDVSSLTVVIRGYLPAKGNIVAMYTGTVSVVNGKWSFTPSAANSAFGGPQGLSEGTYTVVVGQTEASALVTDTLTIQN